MSARLLAVQADDLAEFVDFWIDVRNKLVHQGFPQLDDWVVPSDARTGKTVNTTNAREAFAVFLQLADQTIRVIAEVAGFRDPSELHLPEVWLRGMEAPRGGVFADAHLQLWTGGGEGRRPPSLEMSSA
ncbi:hypothetical protein [Nocardia sp. NPDC058497]|uniref:hypothetical protein n=1 Tax=Nocardia sp. NPDC058497 TaxID=3346529 RepID=UPI00364B61CB